MPFLLTKAVVSNYGPTILAVSRNAINENLVENGISSTRRLFACPIKSFIVLFFRV